MTASASPAGCRILAGGRLGPIGPRMKLVASMTVRSLVLIAVAILLILVLLPTALGAQLASAG